MNKAIKIVLALIAVLVAGLAAVALLFDADQFRPRVNAALTEALHRPTTIGKLSLAIFKGRVEADTLTVADDAAFGNAPFLQAKSIGLAVDLWQLISQRRLNVTGIEISEPVINLIESKAGGWNYATLGAAAGAPPSPPPSSSVTTDLAIRQLQVTNGRLTMSNPNGGAPMVFEGTNISGMNISKAAAFPFTLTTKLATGGDIKIDGRAGPVPADASLTPIQLSAKIEKLNLQPYGVGGLLALDGNGTTDGRTLEWTGLLHIDQAKFSPGGTPAKVPVALEIALKHNVRQHAGEITRGAFHVGKADAAFSGSYAESGDKTSIRMHVSGKAMPLTELAGLLPAFDIQLPAGTSLQSGTLATDMTATGPATDPVVSGTIDAAGAKLGGFNLSQKLSVIERLAGIKPSPDTEIEKLHTRLQTGSAGTAIDDIDLIVAGLGEVTGNGTISPSHELNFRMRATPNVQGGLASIGQAAFGGGNQKTAIPFFIVGTSSNPGFRPDTAAIATEQLDRLRGKTVGGVDAGNAIDAIKGIFGRKSNAPPNKKQ
jgi:AsmA protein